GISSDSSDSEMEDKTTANLALLKLDEWLHLKLDPEAAGLLLEIRQKWHSLFLRRMRAPSKPWSQVDETTVRIMVAILSAEEQSAGLQQPSGIGQRPRPMTWEDLPSASTWRSPTRRKSSAETEFSDDSSNAEKLLMKSAPPTLHQMKEYKEKTISRSKRTSDGRSDQSSVKSTDSSSYPSPCASPSSPVSGK
ncbi:YTDC2 helicase, partial [Rhinoptilus africanus]|nr:YTDC2 helicase [Rhinoptilus africanus]